MDPKILSRFIPVCPLLSLFWPPKRTSGKVRKVAEWIFLTCSAFHPGFCTENAPESPRMFEDSLCIVSWETETIEDSLKSTPFQNAKSPAKSAENIHINFLEHWQSNKRTNTDKMGTKKDNLGHFGNPPPLRIHPYSALLNTWNSEIALNMSLPISDPHAPDLLNLTLLVSSWKIQGKLQKAQKQILKSAPLEKMHRKSRKLGGGWGWGSEFGGVYIYIHIYRDILPSMPV